MDNKNKILCLTPIDHIRGVRDILHNVGMVHYCPDLSYEEAKKVINEFGPEIVFVNPNKMRFKLDAELLKNIDTVCTASTGLNHIDVEYCQKNNKKVISLTTDYDVIEKISSTAEMAFSLMLSLIRNIPSAFEAAKRHEWNYEPFIGRQLNHLTAGVVGYGRLGKMFAHYCKSFGMDVVVYDPYKSIPGIYKSVSYAELLSLSDVISLHVHITNETKGMINAEALSQIKKEGAYLINTARGDIVNEKDVIAAIEQGHLIGYATDVVRDELSDIEKSELIRASDRLNIIVTPHIAGMTREAQEIAYCSVAGRLLDYYGSGKNE